MPGNASRNILYLRNWIRTKVMEIMIKPKAGLVCAGSFMAEICLYRQGVRLQVTTRAMHGGTAKPWQLLPCAQPLGTQDRAAEGDGVTRPLPRAEGTDLATCSGQMMDELVKLQ